MRLTAAEEKHQACFMGSAGPHLTAWPFTIYLPRPHARRWRPVLYE
jgi:hypothetical protein